VAGGDRTVVGVSEGCEFVGARALKRQDNNCPYTRNEKKNKFSLLCLLGWSVHATGIIFFHGYRLYTE